MTFNSIEFLIFLPIVFILYWFVFIKSLRWQNILLLLSSYFFYGWWSWKFLLLIVLSTLLDYIYGFYVGSTNKKKSKRFLWLSIVNNIGILGVFKYYNFFAIEVQHAFTELGLQINPILLNIALPIGISFYTFHGMSYIFDIYRGKQKAVTNFVDYAVFVAFFPLLVAGPIERASHLLPQIQQKRQFNYSQAVDGCKLILWGFFKKVVIADSLAGTVDEIFNNYQHHHALTLILGAISFSFQIYADFSGYSDIAIGTAKLFGFELLTNFKFPYFSRDIAEFWRRWHISLSTWFRDYLYIPLGGSKQGKLKTVRNIFIIFLVSGLWHGANWKYIVWGGIHACGFLPLLLLNRNRIHVNNVVAENRKLPSWKELSQITITFLFVTIAWVFFRANELNQAVDYIKNICTNFKNLNELLLYKNVLYYIITLIVFEWWLRPNERNIHFKYNIILYLIYIITFYKLFNSLFGINNSSFIYFQF